MEQKQLVEIASRLGKVRAEMLGDYPFFGRLIMRLPVALEEWELFSDECGTAYTDMEKIVFDPRFALRLDDEELGFVYLHEILHCVLKHCTRGRGKNSVAYNIACDIVVNSIILEAMGKNDMIVDEIPVMHLAPDGKEGREYSADDIYQMLLKEDIESKNKYSGFKDDHDEWESIQNGGYIDNVWDGIIASAAKSAGNGSGIPGKIKRLIDAASNAPKINWRQILHDFIQFDRFDFTYNPPDNRYEGDFLFPSFNKCCDEENVEKLWFLIDTSASVSGKAVSLAMAEICDAMEQIGGLSGELSFFDSDVSEPEFFDSRNTLMDIEPVGGGGTSFIRIFEKLPEFYPKELPRGIIIITDGYAPFPAEKAALDVPIIWLVVDSPVEPPFGTCVHLSTKEEG